MLAVPPSRSRQFGSFQIILFLNIVQYRERDYKSILLRGIFHIIKKNNVKVLSALIPKIHTTNLLLLPIPLSLVEQETSFSHTIMSFMCLRLISPMNNAAHDSSRLLAK